MKIKVLLFGISSDIVGSDSLDFEVTTNCTVADFKNLLQKQYSELTAINSYAIALNESYASNEDVIKNGDVLAVIPPVSGG